MKHMTWTNDPKPDSKENLQVVLTNIDASTSIFHICCLATSCITAFWSPSSLQGLIVVLFFEHGDVLILLIEYSL